MDRLIKFLSHLNKGLYAISDVLDKQTFYKFENNVIQYSYNGVDWIECHIPFKSLSGLILLLYNKNYLHSFEFLIGKESIPLYMIKRVVNYENEIVLISEDEYYRLLKSLEDIEVVGEFL